MTRLGTLLLPPLSSVYGAITRARINLYDRGTFRSQRLPRPVISVGNITTGGTGKTPLVEWLAKTLAEERRSVCVLTRGYGRKNSDQRVLVSDGSSVSASVTEAGDEAFLLASKLIGKAAVICDADRYAAGEGAIKHLNSDCFVLDDGFQHLRLERDLNVVTIDATNPWGGGNLLPYGRLRESPSGLKRADCLVITRTDQVSDTEALSNELTEFSGGRPIFTSRMREVGLVAVNNETALNADDRRCFAFCGIGNPDSFFELLEKNGYQLAARRAFTDHHVYSQLEIDSITTTAHKAGVEFLVTTEKDAVKLTSLNFSIPCYRAQIEIEIDNAHEFKRLVFEAVNLDKF